MKQAPSGLFLDSVHKRMRKTSLLDLIGLIAVILMGCIVISVNNIANVFKTK